MSIQRSAPSPFSTVFRKARSALVAAAIFSGVINVLMLTGSLFMMQVYDRVLTSRSVPTLVALAAVTMGLYAFTSVLEFVRTRMMVRIGRLADAELRQNVFNRVMEHSVRRTPNVGTQPLRDLDSIRQFLSGPAPFALFDIPWMPLYVAVAFLLHPWLGYMTLGAAFLMAMIAVANEYASRIGASATAQASVKSHILAEEANASAEVVRALGMQSTYATRWSTLVDELVLLQARGADRSSIFSSLSKFLRLVLQSAALGLGAYLAIHNEITAGVIIGASIIMSRALAPIDQAIAHWRQFVSYRQAKSRLEIALKPLGAEDERMKLPKARGEITVEGAIVVAPGTQTPIVQGVAFHIPPGSGLGIVGPSGAGKSSLARAIVGAWPVAKGAIRLDGAKLEQWPLEQLGRSIGYVPQDVAMLSGTIQDNIARFDVNPDPEAVVAAATRANVHDLVLRLPDGYNTRVGAGGAQLSAGQRQRIALARALYGNPAVLVLDEPNSNLDGDGETALFAALQDARAAGTTVVIIAHRPSAIRAVDHLLYIKDGRQVAFGPKDEVLHKIQGERTQARPQPGLTVVGASS